jgi:hypothetical protein
VAHFVIDGAVRNAARGFVEGPNALPDSYLDPALNLINSPRYQF